VVPARFRGGRERAGSVADEDGFRPDVVALEDAILKKLGGEDDGVGRLKKGFFRLQEGWRGAAEAREPIVAVVKDGKAVAAAQLGGRFEPGGKADDEGGFANGGTVDQAGDLADDAARLGDGERTAVQLVLAREVDVEFEEAGAEGRGAGVRVEGVREAILEAEVRIDVDGLGAGSGDGAREVGGALKAGVPVSHGEEEDGGRAIGGARRVGPGLVEVGGASLRKEGVVGVAAVGTDELPRKGEPVRDGHAERARNPKYILRTTA
jgi:hypothetical protein